MKQKKIKRDFKALEKRRLKALELRRQGIKRTEVARIIGVARQTVMRWEKTVEAGGKKAILWNGGNGRPSRMSQAQKSELLQMILEGPEKHGFDTPCTCRRVATLIRNKYGIKYHHDHVWKILRSLRLSVQKPKCRSLARDEKKIKSWKKNSYPYLKKKPKKKAES